jgi:excisionase family DNA binding protein
MTQDRPAKEIFSTHDAARICRVTPMTVIRWIKEGKIPAFKTAGGHRRILYADLVRFCAARGIPFGGGELVEAGRVLVADADSAMREAIAEAVRAVDPGLTLEEAGDAFAAGRQLAEFHPSLIFLDQRLPGVDVHELCARLARDPDDPVAVIILLANHSTDAERAFKSRGALGCVAKPPAPAAIEALVREAFNLPEPTPVETYYIVDRDARSARSLRRDLESKNPGCRVSIFASPVDLLFAIAAQPPDAVVVDGNTLDCDPAELVRRVVARGSAVVGMGGRNDNQAAVVLGAGARIYLTKPVGADDVLAGLRTVRRR